MTIVEKKVAAEADVINLQKAFSMRKALMDIINEKPAPNDRDYEMFAEKNDAYAAAWEQVLNNTFEGKYRTGNFSWDCNFATREITISR